MEAVSRNSVAHLSEGAVLPGAALVRRQHEVSGSLASGPVLGCGDQSLPDAAAAILRADDERQEPGSVALPLTDVCKAGEQASLFVRSTSSS